MNGQRIQVKNVDLQNSCILADAYSYLYVYNFYASSGAKFYAPVGATGYFMTAVANGKTQGACYYGAKPKPRDVIPGALLIEEAGGVIVSFTGKAFDYECTKFIAGTASICNVASMHQTEISSGLTAKE
jgi:fructose-1,6-bisphosphatase/inositol monophosphatase family enzyme